jgi:hypothetical protein
LRLFDANTLFALMFSWLVPQHMPKQLALGYIAEFARVTKPGGVIVFQIPDRRQQAWSSEHVDQAAVPWEFWRAHEPLMLMCETPYAGVIKVLEGAGASDQGRGRRLRSPCIGLALLRGPEGIGDACRLGPQAAVDH